MMVERRRAFRIPFQLNREEEEQIRQDRDRRDRNIFYACCGMANFTAPFGRRNEGRCVQGNNCKHGTHKDSLSYAFDFDLSVGTPVVAAKDGVVVACCGHYTKGGTLKTFKARANFIVLRHADGVYTRYYHLQHKGVTVQPGDNVLQGQIIGYSGNTGFSTGPHLHFDCIDTFSLETSVFEVDFEQTESKENRFGKDLRAAYEEEKEKRGLPEIFFASCCAGFSSMLPSKLAPVQGPLVWAKPRNACKNLENDAGELTNAIVLVSRCKDVDFIDKCRFVQKAGGIAMVVVNYEDGPTIHAMAKGSSFVENEIKIPAIMISKSYGELITKFLDAPQHSVDLENVNIEMQNVGQCDYSSILKGKLYISDHFRLHSGKENIGGPYASKTLPLGFQRSGKKKRKKLYVPKSGALPPRDVLWPDDRA